MTENRLPHQFEYDVRDVTARSWGYGHSYGKDELSGLTCPYGHRYGYDAFRSKIFNRPLEPGENLFPTHACIRAERGFEGVRLPVPLDYLELVVLPDDYPIITDALDEQAKQSAIEQRCRSGQPPEPIAVDLPLVGAPRVARKYMPALAAARALELFEIFARVKYV